MKAKPVLRRKSARIDIDLAADHYEQEAGEDVALRFADAVEAAFRVIGERARYRVIPLGRAARNCGSAQPPGRPLSLSIFYSEHEEHVEVWRVLHAKRDIPATLRGSGEQSE